MLELAQAGFTQLPQCESQARPLTKFTGDELIDKWEAVIASAPAHRITAAHIASIVDDDEPEQQRQLKIDAQTYTQLQEKAARAGLSVREFLKKLVEDFESDDEPEPDIAIAIDQDEDAIAIDKTPMTIEELSKWRDDVEQLLVEYYGLAGTATDSS